MLDDASRSYIQLQRALQADTATFGVVLSYAFTPPTTVVLTHDGNATAPQVAAAEAFVAAWDWSLASTVAKENLQAREDAETLFTLLKTDLGKLLRAVTIVLAKEINLIRAAFCVGTSSGVWDPPSIANGAGATSPTLTVTGATFGTDVVDVSPPYSLQGLVCTGFITAANTVAIRLHNGTGAAVNLGSGTWGVAVRRPQFAPQYTIQQLKDAVVAEVVSGDAD